MADPAAAERAGFVAELGFAESAAQARGYATTLIDAGGQTAPELVITLSTDADGRARMLRASFVPVGDDMEHTKFLQLWVPLPFTIGADASLADVREAAAIVNEHVAIGRFGVHDDATVYFRYILAAPKHSMLDDEMVGEVIVFCDYHQEHFGDYLEGVCDGEISLLVLADVINRSA